MVFISSKRPQILILCGNPADRPALIDFGYTVAKKIGLVICAQVQYVSHYSESWRWVIINAEVHQKIFRSIAILSKVITILNTILNLGKNDT